MIPDAVSPACDSPAEERLFALLRNSTPDELVAFHHVPWLVPTDRGRPREGEADFVVADPARGVLVIEVKGGSIRYDAASGRWFSTGRSGEAEIKDPFAQARDSSHLLLDALRRAKGSRRVLVGHAVAFPDCRVDDRRLRLDAPREIVIDGNDLHALGGRLDAVLGYWQGKVAEPAPGRAGISLLESILANSFTLPAPLSIELRADERKLLRLTEEQYRILDSLARQTRVAIAGCAGSGKTVLAAEKARRLAAQGFRVLVLCYNRLLAEHLRRGLADVPEIDVRTYDGLCREIRDEAGSELPPGPDAGGDDSYWHALRAAFEECADQAAGRYGALVVDEGQDFHPDWWLPLQVLLEDPDGSPLYVFYDDNQRIFPAPEGLPIAREPFQLTVNCRNARPIAELVAQYYEGQPPAAADVAGLPVQLHEYETPKQLLALLEEHVSGWLREAEVAPHDIALLTAKARERSALWQIDRLGGAVLTDDPWDRGGILRCSIHRFKGLERLVVACCELEQARDAVLYVGFSRAKVFLAVYATPEVAGSLPIARPA
jgi:hypothetical protein